MGGKKIPPECILDTRSQLYSSSVLSKIYNLTVKQIQDCAYRNKTKLPVHRAVDENFFKSESDELMYIIGWIASDGCIGAERNTVTLAIKSTDIGILQSIAKIIKYTNIIYETEQFDVRTNKIYKRCQLSFTSKLVVQELAKYNIGPVKSLTYMYPDNFRDDNNRRHFIRGFFDGDGCISIDNQNIVVSFCGPFQLMKDLQLDLNRMLCLERGNVYQRANIRVLQYAGNLTTLRILAWMYEGSTQATRLERKYTRYLEYQMNYNARMEQE